jgi:hypothetical protein
MEAAMFARVKKSGNNQYLQIVENRREKGKVVQRVIVTLGRLDQMTEKGEVEALVRSLSRFSERTLLILSEQSRVSAAAQKIGPALIFERLWKDWGSAPSSRPWLPTANSASLLSGFCF